MASVRDQLLLWFASRPQWQRDLARRLAGKADLGGEEFAEALRIVQAAHSALPAGETAPSPRPLSGGDLPTPTGVGSPRLIGLGPLVGVGAVSGQHTLTFGGEGLTVIYGENASGKSTYVRCLKRVCRSVDRDAVVLGNVYEDATYLPSATVRLDDGAGRGREEQVSLDAPGDIGLEALSVFDADCAEHYVDGENRIAYVPTELRLLARLARTQDQMRSALAQQIERLRSGVPDFSEFSSATAAGRFVRELSGTSNVAKARALATLDADEQDRLKDLDRTFADAAASDAKENAGAARHDARQAADLAKRIRGSADQLSDVRAREINALADEAAQSRAAAEVAKQEFAGAPLPGVGDEVWRRLWEAARAVAEGAGAAFPPRQAELCPLCLQELGPSAASQMARFDELVLAETQRRADRAQRTLQEARNRIGPELLQRCRTTFLNDLAGRESGLHRSLTEYLDALESRRADLSSESGSTHLAPSPADPAGQLTAWGESRDKRAQELEEALDPGRRRALEEEQAELHDRQRLAERLADVERHIANLALLDALSSTREKLATNAITMKQREIVESTVTDGMVTALTEELRGMRCGHLSVSLRPEGHRGETQVRLLLGGADPSAQVSQVASEGEQRALSLAFFLAEVRTSEGDGAIILDDPMSSFDGPRRTHVAERLVEEGRRRQVIVFTHDLPFMLDLLDRAKERAVEAVTLHVWRRGADVGRVDDDLPFYAQKARKRFGVLKEDAQAWDNRVEPSFDAEWTRACDFYRRLRETWERAIEERLFRGVVQRFQREVKTQSLRDVIVTSELTDMVEKSMDRCSLFVHDRAAQASQSDLPDRARLEEDLQVLEGFLQLTK